MIPSTKQAFDLLKDALQEKTGGELVFPVKSIDDCYNQDTLLDVGKREREITDEAFATALSLADDETKKSLEFLQTALTPSEILKMSGISVNYEIEEYPIEVKREAVYQDRGSVEHDGRVEQYLNNSRKEIAACVRQEFDKECPWCKETGVYNIEPYSYHDELRYDELKSCFKEYQKNDGGYATFSDFLYFKYREDYCRESIASTEKEIVDEIKEAVEGNDELDSAFKDAVLRYLDETEMYEIFDDTGISVKADPVNFMCGDFHFMVTLSTPQEKNMGNSSIESLFDADPSNIGWLESGETVDKIANNALSYIARSQGYEMNEILDKFHLASEKPDAYLGTPNFATKVSEAYASAPTYEVNENVRMLVAMSGREALDFIDRLTSDPSTFGTDAVLKINAGTNLALVDNSPLIPTEKDVVVPISLATKLDFNDEYSSRDYSETIGLLQGEEVTSLIKASSEDFVKPLTDDKVAGIKAEMNEWIEESTKEADTPSRFYPLLTDD